MVYTIEGLATLHLNQGQPERAARLFAWADATRERIGNDRPPIEQAEVDKDIAACLAELGEPAFSNACNEGKKMSPPEAIAHAQEEN